MSGYARNQVFSSIHTVGSLLPADMLLRIAEGKDVPGCLPADYRVVGTRSVRDDAERHWDYLRSVWSELRDKLPAAPEAETPADPTRLSEAESKQGSLTAVALFAWVGDHLSLEIAGRLESKRVPGKERARYCVPAGNFFSSALRMRHRPWRRLLRALSSSASGHSIDASLARGVGPSMAR